MDPEGLRGEVLGAQEQFRYICVEFPKTKSRDLLRLLERGGEHRIIYYGQAGVMRDAFARDDARADGLRTLTADDVGIVIVSGKEVTEMRRSLDGVQYITPLDNGLKLPVRISLGGNTIARGTYLRESDRTKLEQRHFELISRVLPVAVYN